MSEILKMFAPHALILACFAAAALYGTASIAAATLYGMAMELFYIAMCENDDYL